VLLVLTAIFDNVLVATGIVGYDPSRISGVFVGVAPLEDFAYAIAAVVLLPSLWALLGGPDTRPPAATRPAAMGTPP
jgi:lycopene cyclase domain-containing protein